ncbi:MAG: hypothetical protein KAH17_06860 [Bacteroidales bacterium]|nr:hypothetical protein [Bacteroidales bacterium]
MKKQVRKIQYFLIGTAMLFVLPGCLDIYFTTEIKPNGEISKTVVFEGDSTEILDVYFPFMEDESWEREWIYIDKDKSKLILSKTFKNAKQASLDLNPDDSLPYIRIQPELNKKFRWFFSYYEYTDLFLASNPFDKIDWREYLTEEEVGLISMDEEDREADPGYNKSEYKTVEKRFEDYLLNSGFEEFFLLFMQALRNTNEIDLKEEAVLAQKQELFKLAVAGKNDYADAILMSFQDILDSADLAKIGQQNIELFGYFDKKIDFFESVFDDNLYFTIRMPGLLINTNSNQIEGNSLSWELDSFDAYFNDYPMTAESRIVNIWAFVVAGIAIAILLFSLIWSVFRRKKA